MSKQYTLTYNPSFINFRPATELEEIFQNINTIMSTPKYSVPLFKEFGLNASFVDQPINIINPKLVAEIVEAVEKYEQRVIVEEVKMTANQDGQVYPTVVFSLRNEVNS